MLLAPVNNAGPPFCCPTHLETPLYNNNHHHGNTTMSEARCINCINSPNDGSTSEVRGFESTLSTTVAAQFRRPDEPSSSEGEISEYEDDDETTVEDSKVSITEEEPSEDLSSIAESSEGFSMSNRSEGDTPRSASPMDEETSSSDGPEGPGLVQRPSRVTSETTPLVSVLKRKNKRIRGVSRRRVRGLWGSHEEDYFASVHDDVLQNVLSFGSLAEVCTMSMVSRRWNYMATKESSFQTVDATEFIDRAFQNFTRKSSPPAKAARETAEALSKALENHTPRSLTIRNINEKLCPDTYLPSLKGLQQLTLEKFSNLSDTHIHVWMISNTVGQGRPRDIHLRSLQLKDCPKLSNAAVRTLARHCPLLQELGLAGIPRIDSLDELSSLWRVEGQLQLHKRTGSNLAHVSTSSLRSLDGPPLTGPGSKLPPPLLQPLWGESSVARMPEAEGMSSLFEPPSTSSKTTSFFAPPKKPSRSALSDAKKANPLASMFATPSEKPAPVFTPTNDNKASPLLCMFAPPEPSKKPSNPLSGIFSPPKVSPTTSIKSAPPPMAGLFAPPKAASPTVPSKKSPPPLPDLSGLFAPKKIAPLSASNPSVAGLFSPPALPESSKTLPSTLEKTPTNSSSPGPNSLAGLFSGAPQVSATATQNSLSRTSSLFVPPKAKSDGPSMTRNAHLEAAKPLPAFTKSPKTESGSLLSPRLSPSFVSQQSVEGSESLPIEDKSDISQTQPPATFNQSQNTSDQEQSCEIEVEPSGLFVPQSNHELEPPQSPTKNPAAGLESLFCPPGDSPGAPAQTMQRPTIGRCSSLSTAQNPGRLDRIDVSRTGVKPGSILESLRKASGRVFLQALECRGTSRWSEDEVRELTKVVSFAKMRLLDLDYDGPVVEDIVLMSHRSENSQDREPF